MASTRFTAAPYQSDATSNHSPTTALLSDGLDAELCRRLCSQLDWGHGCSTATNLAWWIGGGRVHSALGHGSLQTFQTEIAVYDTHYGGHREIPDSVIIWRVERQVCGRPSWLSVSSSIAATVSSTCVLTSVWHSSFASPSPTTDLLTVHRADTSFGLRRFCWLYNESGMDYHMRYGTATHFRVTSLIWRHILLPPSHGQLAPHSQVAPPIAFLMTKLARAK